VSREVGYVVVCFNQASGRPDVEPYSFSDERDDAEKLAVTERAKTAEVGRRERYAVARVVIDEDPV
jgi:hypothetical protein